MTNYEYFKQEIEELEKNKRRISIKEDEPVRCLGCGFCGDCYRAVKDENELISCSESKLVEWAMSEYKEKLKTESRTESAYEKSIKEMISHCESVLIEKHREYATEDDFHNFNVAAELQNITPLQALVGMMDKHVVSVHDYVNEHAEGRKATKEQWKEKIGDNINYLLILWAMVNHEGK